MLDYERYLSASDDVLLREHVRVTGELCTALQELSAARVGYESAYVHTLLSTEGSVAERERLARGNAMHLRVAIIEVESSVSILERELALIDYLRTANAQRRPSMAGDQ